MTKIHRFIGKYLLGKGTMRLDDAELSHQMRSVLKLTAGETVIVGDGTGLEAQCRILEYQGDAVLLECVSVGRNPNEPAVRLTLYLAVLKADHFEQAAAMAVQAGAFRVVPILTERTVKQNLRLDRVDRILKEAAETAGRALAPEAAEVMTMESALSDAAHLDENLFFDPSGAPYAGVAKRTRTAGVWVGPEGGWDERELQVAARSGLTVVSLGPLILKADTAAAVTSWLVVNWRKS
jgi:16S rRNA (uracil1498-N3)-methyltransferase